MAFCSNHKISSDFLPAPLEGGLVGLRQSPSPSWCGSSCWVCRSGRSKETGNCQSLCPPRTRTRGVLLLVFLLVFLLVLLLLLLLLCSGVSSLSCSSPSCPTREDGTLSGHRVELFISTSDLALVSVIVPLLVPLENWLQTLSPLTRSVLMIAMFVCVCVSV